MREKIKRYPVGLYGATRCRPKIIRDSIWTGRMESLIFMRDVAVRYFGCARGRECAAKSTRATSTFMFRAHLTHIEFRAQRSLIINSCDTSLRLVKFLSQVLASRQHPSRCFLSLCSELKCELKTPLRQIREKIEPALIDLRLVMSRSETTDSFRRNFR